MSLDSAAWYVERASRNAGSDNSLAVSDLAKAMDFLVKAVRELQQRVDDAAKSEES